MSQSLIKEIIFTTLRNRRRCYLRDPSKADAKAVFSLLPLGFICSPGSSKIELLQWAISRWEREARILFEQDFADWPVGVA